MDGMSEKYPVAAEPEFVGIHLREMYPIDELHRVALVENILWELDRSDMNWQAVYDALNAIIFSESGIGKDLS